MQASELFSLSSIQENHQQQHYDPEHQGQHQSRQRRQNPHRPVRLRLACDSCSATKVKCDKGRPACSRCVNNGLPCVYSVSRRHGSEPWFKRMQKQPQNQHGTSSDISQNTQTRPPNSPSQLPLQHTQSPGDNSMGLIAPHPYQSWDHGDFSFCDDYLNPELFNNNVDETHINNFLGQALVETSSAGANEPAVSSEDPLGSGHDCEGRASEILRSLHYHPNHFTGLSPTSMGLDHDGSSSSGDETAIPSVDKIMVANRKILVTLPDLLACPCARYPHLALLYISIFSKALFWYRVAVSTHSRIGTSTDGTMRHTSPGQMRHSSIHSAGSDNGPSMMPVRIQLGELPLDADDQATLQSGILLRELRKMKRAIDRFITLDVSWAADDAKTSGEASATQWYRLAMPKICQELDALIQIALGNRDMVA